MGAYGKFKEISFKERCEFWVNSLNNYDYLQTKSSAITVRHEDFVNNPLDQIKRICRHLQLDYHPDMLDQAQSVLTHSMSNSNDISIDVKEALQSRKNPYLSWQTENQNSFNNICGD